MTGWTYNNYTLFFNLVKLVQIIEYAKFHFELYMHDRNTALDRVARSLHFWGQIVISVVK